MPVLQLRQSFLVGGVVAPLVLPGLGVQLELVEEHGSQLDRGRDIQCRLSGLLAYAGLYDREFLAQLLAVGGQHVRIYPHSAVFHVGQYADQRHLDVFVQLSDGRIPVGFFLYGPVQRNHQRCVH